MHLAMLVIVHARVECYLQMTASGIDGLADDLQFNGTRLLDACPVLVVLQPSTRASAQLNEHQATHENSSHSR